MKERIFIGDRKFCSLLYALLIGLILHSSCEKPEPFSMIPKIEFLDLVFAEDSDDGIADSLILSFHFEDGDGDLGLPSDDRYFPIQDYYAIVNENLTPISISDETLPKNQFLYVPPEFNLTPDTPIYFPFDNVSSLPSYDCDSYEIVYINAERSFFFGLNSRANVDLEAFAIDTILIEKNPNRYNFYIEFFRKRGNEYEPLELSTPGLNGCIIPLNGRFPLLDLENIGGSLEGVIKYSMTSLGFRIRIRSDEFKMKFYIFDHHFNKSNVVETIDFTLDQIRRR